MRNLLHRSERDSILSRIQGLDSQSAPRWGSMTVSQMMCHCSDAFRGALGEKDVAVVGSQLHRTIVKWIALYGPFPFPRGYGTMPELDPDVGGTAPTAFENDRAQLVALIERFSALTATARMPEHPLFGTLTMNEWGQWAFRHTDHHLRQFGV